jgi:hypothetical protein
VAAAFIVSKNKFKCKGASYQTTSENRISNIRPCWRTCTRVSRSRRLQWLGIAVGNAPGAVPGGATWLPVTTLTRAELDHRIAETGKLLGSVIHQEYDRLARLVTQSNQLKVTAPLAYCLREVSRNVFEHAETDCCVLCAQKCADEEVELAVIDQGRGIRRSLERKTPICQRRGSSASRAPRRRKSLPLGQATARSRTSCRVSTS